MISSCGGWPPPIIWLWAVQTYETIRLASTQTIDVYQCGCFPSHGGTPGYHPFLDGIFHDKPSILGNRHIPSYIKWTQICVRLDMCACAQFLVVGLLRARFAKKDALFKVGWDGWSKQNCTLFENCTRLHQMTPVCAKFVRVAAIFPTRGCATNDPEFCSQRSKRRFLRVWRNSARFSKLHMFCQYVRVAHLFVHVWSSWWCMYVCIYIYNIDKNPNIYI